MKVTSLEDFESAVLKSKGPVLVDFSAAWCGPCRALAPIIHEIEADGGIKVIEVDIDKLREAAIKHRVMSVPTLMIFVNGKPVDMVLGFKPKEELEAWIDRVKKSARR